MMIVVKAQSGRILSKGCDVTGTIETQCFRAEGSSSKDKVWCQMLPDHGSGGIDQREPIAFSDMEVTANLSSHGEALRTHTEDKDLRKPNPQTHAKSIMWIS